jgi:hypothetical protein
VSRVHLAASQSRAETLAPVYDLRSDAMTWMAEGSFAADIEQQHPT